MSGRFTLTDYDRAFLDRLYRSRPDLDAHAQRASIVSRMQHDANQ